MPERVSDLLRRKGTDIVSTGPESTVYEAIETMVKHNVGSILVLDGEDIAGIFTERDYLREIVLQGRTSKTTRVEEVMTSDILTVSPEETIEKCMAIMTEHKCRHLPVVYDGALVGIISIGDCVKHLSRKARDEVKDLRAYISGRYPT